ncbi:MAG: DUF1501 domain-containing protein [Bryobacteraceae bacterium]
MVVCPGIIYGLLLLEDNAGTVAAGIFGTERVGVWGAGGEFLIERGEGWAVDESVCGEGEERQLSVHAWGPSHLDTFDPKPVLNRLHGQKVPPSFGKVDFQFSNMDKTPLMGSPLRFRKRGKSGLEISELFEHVAQHADDLAVIRSCHHDGFTHVTRQTWMNTGWGARARIWYWVRS